MQSVILHPFPHKSQLPKAIRTTDFLSAPLGISKNHPKPKEGTQTRFSYPPLLPAITQDPAVYEILRVPSRGSIDKGQHFCGTQSCQ